MSESTPTPRGWTGGNKDFEMIRNFDGHIVGSLGFDDDRGEMDSAAEERAEGE